MPGHLSVEIFKLVAIIPDSVNDPEDRAHRLNAELRQFGASVEKIKVNCRWVVKVEGRRITVIYRPESDKSAIVEMIEHFGLKINPSPEMTKPSALEESFCDPNLLPV